MDKASIFKKLKINESLNILIVNAPPEYMDLFKNFSTVHYKVSPTQKKSFDFVQIFAQNQAELERLVLANANAGKYDCCFWACYPKGGGKIKSDIKRDTVWKAFELIKLRPVFQIAIDDTWSALRARPSDLY